MYSHPTSVSHGCPTRSNASTNLLYIGHRMLADHFFIPAGLTIMQIPELALNTAWDVKGPPQCLKILHCCTLYVQLGVSSSCANLLYPQQETYCSR